MPMHITPVKFLLWASSYPISKRQMLGFLAVGVGSKTIWYPRVCTLDPSGGGGMSFELRTDNGRWNVSFNESSLSNEIYEVTHVQRVRKVVDHKGPQCLITKDRLTYVQRVRKEARVPSELVSIGVGDAWWTPSRRGTPPFRVHI